jgi:hypothetical protein
LIPPDHFGQLETSSSQIWVPGSAGYWNSPSKPTSNSESICRRKFLKSISEFFANEPTKSSRNSSFAPSVLTLMGQEILSHRLPCIGFCWSCCRLPRHHWGARRSVPSNGSGYRWCCRSIHRFVWVVVVESRPMFSLLSWAFDSFKSCGLLGPTSS